MENLSGKIDKLKEAKSYLLQKPHVVHWIWSLSLGGDAKNLCALAIAQQSWARVSILTRTPEPGVRIADLKNTDIEVFPGMDEQDKLENWINNHNPSIVVFHRNGKPDVVEGDLLTILHRANIPIFEYNTFARVDASTDRLWTGHAHLSCTSMMQYATRLGVSPLSLVDHAAIGYAVDLPKPIDQEERMQARKTLGIEPQSFVVLRLVRPDLRKWDPLPVLALTRLKQKGFPVHLLVRSAPAVRHSWISQKLGKNVTLLEPTENKDEVRMTFAASDCSVNYSHIGETFGLALAEAMVHGLPVVVNSTPNMDNAQVELCQYGKTGIISNTISSVASALQHLSDNGTYANQLAWSGKDFIENTFATAEVEARLRRFIIERLRAKRPELVSLIPSVVSQISPYVLDQRWLDNNSKQTEQVVTQSGDDLRSWIEAKVLDYLRLSDSIQYALDLGPGAILHSIGQRLKSGSLGRG
jgi:Glycosyl transferases group 1